MTARRPGLAEQERVVVPEVPDQPQRGVDHLLAIEGGGGQLGLEDDDAPLVRLSGGQRTRAALAGAIFAAPDFLLLDEPTNNLDRDGRQAVRDLLHGWRAGAIVVSHDRELLDAMDAIVELTTLGAQRYGGNWSQYRARKAIELAAAEQDLASAERRVAEVERKAQVATERQQRRDAAGSRSAAKGGMPRILLGARKEKAERLQAAFVKLRDNGTIARILDGWLAE